MALVADRLLPAARSQPTRPRSPRPVPCARRTRSATACAALPPPGPLGDGAPPSTSSPPPPSWPHDPLSRRQVALGAGAVLLGAGAGPQAAQAAKAVTLRDGTVVQAYEHGMSISIVALRGSVPASWAADFKDSIGRYSGFSLDQRAQLQDIFKELSDTSGANKRSAGVADVATLGDSWLAAAVQRGLVQPLRGAESYRWYRLLPPRLRQLVRRNAVTGAADPRGAVYGAPYRWGCTLIAYRRDRLLRRGGGPVLDWGDLLQPALAGRLAMTDSPRELLAAAVRSLGSGPAAGEGGSGEGGGGGRLLSVNASAAELAAAGVSEQVLRDRVDAFRRQARLFSSRDHVRALQAGDVWAVVGNSQDLVQLAERSGNVELVAPLSGTQLWADVWAVPSGAQGGHRRMGPSPLLPAWIEFTLSPGRITGQPGLKAGAPPAALAAAAAAAAADPAATAVLSSIHAHREHLLAARRAAARRAPVAAALAGLRGALPPSLQTYLPAPDLPDGGGGGADRDGGAAAAGPEPSHGDAASPSGAGGWLHGGGGGAYPPVELHHAAGYLPPAAVLARSEFLLPLDAATLEMYGRVLGGGGGGGGAGG